MTPLKKYIQFSLLLHLFVLVTATIIGIFSSAKKGFIVFGAHTAKPSAVKYKANKSPTPFVKTSKFGKSKHGKEKTGKGRSKKSSGKKHQKNVPAKSVPPPKKAPPQKKVAKKSKQAKTQLSEASPQQLKKTPPKPLPKKPDQESEPEEPAEPEIVIEEKAPEALKQQDQEPESDPVAEPEESELSNNSDDDAWQETDDDMEFDTNDTDHKNIKIYQTHIQREVARLWRPPIGVPKGTVCSILFTLDEEGHVKKCEITKRSRMLIYDLSITRVAKNFKFNKYLWNRKFTIDFRQ